MKEDIYGITSGLRNAMERGYSLAKAKETFIAAGYDSADVDEAARSISGAQMLEAKKDTPKPGLAPMPSKAPMLPELPKPETLGKAKKKTNFTTILIIATAAVAVLLILTLLARALKIL